jgi:hypothetical protein
VVLAVVLLSAGIILALAALVLRPDESHGAAEAATVAGEHQAAEQHSEESTGDTADHSETTEVSSAAESEHAETSEDATGAETGHTEPTEVTTGETTDHADTAQDTTGTESQREGTGQDQPEPTNEDQHSDTVLGVDLETYNLASPRLVFALIGLTVLLAVGLLIRRSVWLLAACVVLGIAGVAITLHEATHAGEELGIFVPLPLLASVLYGAAACLAGLALIGVRTESRAIQSADAALETAPPKMTRH